MADKLLSRKGQGTLETAFVIIVAVLLLGGIMNIWLWANTQIVRRQRRYNAGRVVAGTATDSYTLRWPVYAPEALDEDSVVLDVPELN